MQVMQRMICGVNPGIILSRFSQLNGVVYDCDNISPIPSSLSTRGTRNSLYSASLSVCGSPCEDALLSVVMDYTRMVAATKIWAAYRRYRAKADSLRDCSIAVVSPSSPGFSNASDLLSANASSIPSSNSLLTDYYHSQAD